MARPKKKPNYEPAALAQELIEVVAELYLHPSTGEADQHGHTEVKIIGG